MYDIRLLLQTFFNSSCLNHLIKQVIRHFYFLLAVLSICQYQHISEGFEPLKPQSHRRCDCDAIALRLLKLTIAKKSQRPQEGFIKVATRSPIGRRTKSIVSSLLSMYKRQAATNLVAKRFYLSLRGRLGSVLIFITDYFPTVQPSVLCRKGQRFFAN